MQRSRLGEVIRDARIESGVSQEELGRACGVDRSTISAYECGRLPVPSDIVCRISRALPRGGHKIQSQACFECRISLLTMPYLDRVDQHPLTVREKLIQELEEAAQALRSLDLVNKLDDRQLTQEDRKALDAACEQLADLFAGLHTQFAVWADRYGVGVDGVALKAYDKLFSRGYCSPQTVPEVPLSVNRAAA